jgi:hypothetical protein
MHLTVFLKLKTLKTLSSGQVYKKTKKRPKKKPKKRKLTGLGFFFFNRVFSNPARRGKQKTRRSTVAICGTFWTL